jgi:hypothetical protein
VTAESNQAVCKQYPFCDILQVIDVAALITTGPSKVDKGGAFPKELRAKEIEARRPGHVVSRNKATGELAASALELLTELAALEFERLNPAKVIARDDKGKFATAIAELTKKLSDLKGGKALRAPYCLLASTASKKSRYFAAGLILRNRNQKKRKQREDGPEVASKTRTHAE